MMNQAQVKKDTSNTQESTQVAESCCGDKLGKTIESLSSVGGEVQQQDQVQPGLLLSGGANLAKKSAMTEDCCATKKDCCKPK